MDLGHSRRFLAAAALAALALAVPGCGGGDDTGTTTTTMAQEAPVPAPPPGSRKLPNVVFIYTDDQDEGSFTPELMPHTFRRIVDPGTRLEESVVATPLCCPSRATYLTGQYPHNNGVFTNAGGYPAMVEPQSTLATWMQQAGYRTAWIGKFLQGYESVAEPTEPAPGFSDWAVTLLPRYFDYELSEDGETVSYGSDPGDYHSDVVTDRAVSLIEEQAGPSQPLYVTANYLAPHKGDRHEDEECSGFALPAPRDAGSADDVRTDASASFDERDVSDKTLYNLSERVAGERLRKLQTQVRCRAESLRAVDRGVERIYRAVKAAGELDNTIFLFASDNGLSLGQHRITGGKGIPYEEALRVPFAMRVPKEVLGADQVPQSRSLVANVDLAPTILDLTGVEPCLPDGACRQLDGRSIAPVLRGKEASFEDRTILIEGGSHKRDCDFAGVRTARAVLLYRTEEAEDGECAVKGDPEVYDLVDDPLQLENLVVEGGASADALRADLESRFERLRDCAGPRDCG